MRFLRPALFLILPLLLPVLVEAQIVPQRDPQAVTVLANAHAAMGGPSLAVAHGGRPRLLAAGTYTVFQGNSSVSHPIRVKVLGYDKVRWEVSGPEGTVTTIVSGNAAWSTAGSKTTRLSVSQIPGRSLEYLPVLNIGRWLTETDAKAYLIQDESSVREGVQRILLRPVYKRIADGQLQKVIEEVARCELKIDKTTSQVVGLRYYEHPGDWRIDLPVDLVFSNYQRIGGYSFPLTVTRYIYGQKASEIQFLSFDFNAVILDTEFAEKRP